MSILRVMVYRMIRFTRASLRRRCVDENINRTQCYLPLVTYHCFYDSPVQYPRFTLVVRLMSRTTKCGGLTF